MARAVNRKGKFESYLRSQTFQRFSTASPILLYEGLPEEAVYGRVEKPWVVVGNHVGRVRLLGKLLIQQTKPRAHHCGDNGLVEAKNGAVIRKHIGFGYIDAKHAEAVDRFAG